MAKKGVIMYYDLLEQLEDFSDEDFGKITRAMIEYDKTGKLPNFEGQLKIAFKFIKLTIDRNKEEYEQKCEKNRENINKRWKKEDTTEYDGIRAYTNYTDKDKDKDKDIDIDTKERNIIKKERHKYGTYGWFLLTDEEKNRLNSEFGEEYINKVIDILDENIQSNGNKNKYKDWNLVIRKAIRDKWSCLNVLNKPNNYKVKYEDGSEYAD